MVVKLKCIVIGGGKIGKSSLLHTYKDFAFPTDYEVPSCPNFQSRTINADGTDYQLDIHDAPEYQFDEYYQDADVCLLVYSLIDRSSFEDIQSKYYREVQRVPGPRTAPFVLVGTKKDRRDEGTAKESVSTEEGNQLSKSINANHFVECSSMTQQGLREVFDYAVRAFQKSGAKPKGGKSSKSKSGKKSGCIIN
ncbi:Rho GTPase [Tieghemostelium lacteum]|uniref:Rho GTPase n=1 Tax=Tieghemostelium lacteum TaxID=361077 RepID=A0A151ZCC8_TIELA|nr:Rho GTPase [Tieghemostelium lacteum]|eukprot:KYQ91534.1 Rho GTPase [Tieghemostelium lacteum]